MAYDPMLQLFGDDPEALKEFERIKALRGDVSSAKRLQKLGAVGALATDEGLRGFGDNLYRTGAAQEDRYKEALAQGYEGLKQTRSAAAQRAEEKAWREKTHADQLAYQQQQLAIQRAQEARMREQASQAQWDIVPDSVRGGFARINKRTGEVQYLGAEAAPTQPGTDNLPPSGLPVAQPGGKPPSEGESKSGVRAAVSTGALTDLYGAQPSSLKPGIAETFAGMAGANAPTQTFIAGLTGGKERVNVRGAQDSFIDSALTEMTGAAYTEAQINAFRNRFMPNYFDDANSIRQKMDNAVDFAKQQAIASGRAWTPERDRQFRTMLLQASQLPVEPVGQQPQGGMAPMQGVQPGATRNNPIVLE